METDILISLDDDKSQKIAEVISNKTSKKILQYLTQKEGTVTDIAHELKIPINTTDYNIKKLLASGLIEKKSFWWSVKGKKMPTYGVSNKRIIISPKSFQGMKKYALAFLTTGFIALTAKTYQYLTKPVQYIAKDAQNMFLEEATAPTLAKATEIIATAPNIFSLGPIDWFIIGAWFSILLLVIFSLISERRSK